MNQSNRKATLNSILGRVAERLEGLGIELGEELEASFEDLVENMKVVCVSPDLGESVREMGTSPREHTVMARVDEATLKQLDAWVESGAVKSRSEAAALFIREGLQVRSDELAELEDALRKVEKAKQKLREKAKRVFGNSGSDAPGDD